MTLPTLTTARLLLRPFVLQDAVTVQRLAGERIIAEMTAAVPHPYMDGMADEWIATHQDAYEAQSSLTLAITRKFDRALVGAMSLLSISVNHRRAELGYWIGRELWNNGFGTEAARAMIEFGFAQLALQRIYARCFASNLASARVMEKAGMQFEGRLRVHELRADRFEDVLLYAALANER